MGSFEDKIRALHNQKQKQMIPELNDMERQYFKENVIFILKKFVMKFNKGY